MIDFQISVGYHLTDRCNLKCVSCNNFCPLVPDDAVDKPIEQIKSDLLLLSKFRDHVKLLSLMGGEPTLRKDLGEIVEFARTLFPFSIINIATNGILLNRLIEIKDIIKRNRIVVAVTQYPFAENAQEIYDTLKRELGDSFEDMCEGSGLVKDMQYQMLSNKFVNSTDEDIQNCRMREACNQLMNGRLYMCNCTADFKFLKDYFKDGIKIQTDGTEYVDLNTCTEEDIFDLNYTRIPLICRYCKESIRKVYPYDFEYVDWRRSNKTIDEWIETE